MSYQQITVVGNVGRDAEIRYLRTGEAVADFSVAVSKVTGKGEQRKEKTTWFKVTVWREYAETVSKYVKKGMKILVVGEVSASAYTDKKTDEARASLEITATNVIFLTRAGEPAPELAPAGGPGGESAPTDKFDDFDGDIPF